MLHQEDGQSQPRGWGTSKLTRMPSILVAGSAGPFESPVLDCFVDSRSDVVARDGLPAGQAANVRAVGEPATTRCR
jgi:hypothetical protein